MTDYSKTNLDLLEASDEFERWVSSTYKCGALTDIERALMWSAWQARAALDTGSVTDKASTRQVPAGQTPLDARLSHPLLLVFAEGEKARDTGAASPYHGHSLEHCLHAAGWVQRDLMIALDAAKKRLAAPQPPASVNAGKEPVAWVNKSHLDAILERSGKVYWHAPIMCGSWFKGAFPLYTAPPAQPGTRKAAEEMREKCAREVEVWAKALSDHIADAVRTLPLPGDKEG